MARLRSVGKTYGTRMASVPTPSFRGGAGSGGADGSVSSWMRKTFAVITGRFKFGEYWPPAQEGQFLEVKDNSPTKPEAAPPQTFEMSR